MYDRAHSKIGFWKTNCSELWERLRTSDDNAHAPSISTKSHGSDMAPASAPIESPHYTIPGMVNVEVYVCFYSFILVQKLDGISVGSFIIFFSLYVDIFRLNLIYLESFKR